jgi:hypothetical protein
MSQVTVRRPFEKDVNGMNCYNERLRLIPFNYSSDTVAR